MSLELLYFDGCPGYEALLPRLTAIAAEAGAHLVLRPVETQEEAEASAFLGSPSVRVNGVDVDPDATTRDDYGIKCRLYRTAEGQTRAPPEHWIRDALAGSSTAARGNQPRDN